MLSCLVVVECCIGIEILVATIEATQSLDSNVLQQAMASTVYSTFYANISFNENHQANMVLLGWQVMFSFDIFC